MSSSRSLASIALGILVSCAAACSFEWEKAKPQARDAGQIGDAGAREHDGGSAHPEADASSVPSAPQCTRDEDCGDTSAFACQAGQCLEYECHPAKSCKGVAMCTDHRCVPFVPPQRLPSGFFQSNGGGLATSSKYRMRWSVGAPQPFGAASSSRYRITLGPGAGR